MDEETWRRRLKSHRRQLPQIALGLGALGAIMIASATTEWELRYLALAGGALVLAIAIAPIAIRVLPVFRPWTERTASTLTVVAYPRGRFALVAIPIAAGMAASSYTAFRLGPWEIPVLMILGAPLAVVLILVSAIDARYTVSDQCVTEIVDYGFLIRVREVHRPTIAWLDETRLILHLAGAVTATDHYRWTKIPTTKKKERITFGLSTLSDEMATEFVSEIVRRTGVEITYGGKPDEMLGTH